MDFPAANPKILQDIWRRQEGRKAGSERTAELLRQMSGRDGKRKSDIPAGVRRRRFGSRFFLCAIFLPLSLSLMQAPLASEIAAIGMGAESQETGPFLIESQADESGSSFEPLGAEAEGSISGDAASSLVLDPAVSSQTAVESDPQAGASQTGDSAFSETGDPAFSQTGSAFEPAPSQSDPLIADGTSAPSGGLFSTTAEEAGSALIESTDGIQNTGDPFVPAVPAEAEPAVTGAGDELRLGETDAGFIEEGILEERSRELIQDTGEDTVERSGIPMDLSIRTSGIADGGRTVNAGHLYQINGVLVRNSDFPSAHYQCWTYANNMYTRIWGHGFSNLFNDPENMLRYLSDSQLTLTVEHLKAYVSMAPAGSVLRICDAQYLHGDDGWGHSQIIISHDENGFTVFEGGLALYPYRREAYFSYDAYVNSGWPGKYQYIKYIKNPWGSALSSSAVVVAGLVPEDPDSAMVMMEAIDFGADADASIVREVLEAAKESFYGASRKVQSQFLDLWGDFREGMLSYFRTGIIPELPEGEKRSFRNPFHGRTYPRGLFSESTEGALISEYGEAASEIFDLETEARDEETDPETEPERVRNDPSRKQETLEDPLYSLESEFDFEPISGTFSD